MRNPDCMVQYSLQSLYPTHVAFSWKYIYWTWYYADGSFDTHSNHWSQVEYTFKEILRFTIRAMDDCLTMPSVITRGTIPPFPPFCSNVSPHNVSHCLTISQIYIPNVNNHPILYPSPLQLVNKTLYFRSLSHHSPFSPHSFYSLFPSCHSLLSLSLLTSPLLLTVPLLLLSPTTSLHCPQTIFNIMHMSL